MLRTPLAPGSADVPAIYFGPAFLAAGQLPPIHTWAEWKQLGYKVRPGEHARITTKLRKMSAAKKTEDGEEEPHFYLAKAFLFTADQVERYLEVTA